jgi:hypothetical protein
MYICITKHLTMINHSFTKEELIGRRVVLHKMNDDPKTNPIQPETMGTIVSVDDMDYYKVEWDNGRTLNLLPDEDDFEFIN